MSILALSDALGTAVRDARGSVCGRIREIAVEPQEHPTRVAYLVVRIAGGERMLPASTVASWGASVRTTSDRATWAAFAPSDGMLLLGRDVLDQQIIDVHGRKVVRVNDIEIDASPSNGHVILSVTSVDVGARGAVRRLIKGLVPSFTLRALLERIPPRVIPWQFVDLIETDPARRVKLKIAYEGLSRMHPADIADIVEDLPPAEREAVFETLDEEVAAGALEEIEPNIKVSILESLERERAADIVEEMDPAAAADLLGDMPEDRSGEILQEMEPDERREVTQLLEFGQRTAAGRMTTDYFAVDADGTVDDAIRALRSFEGGPESVSVIYLIDAQRRLVGCVPLLKIATSLTSTRLLYVSETPVICEPDTPDDEVAELFDKYNQIGRAHV
jgi:magnesium transporter